MKFSLRNILLLTTACGALFFAFGCTQHDDVVKPQTSSTLTLNPVYLPELEDIYAYEMWMVKVQNEGDDFTAPDAEFVSVGKFLWDNSVFRFRNLEGEAISNKVELPSSWFNYDYVVVSIENMDDPDPNQPSGVYMLADEVLDQEIRPIVMKYPGYLFPATGYYFVGTPTNDTTYYDIPGGRLVRVQQEEEKGLWLCSRFLTERFLHDTLSVLSLDVVVVPDTFDTAGRYDVDTVGILWPEDSLFTVIIDSVYFGYDTLQHRRIEITWDTLTDTLYDYILFPEFRIDSITTVAYPYPLGRIPYYEYTSPIDGLVDIEPYGWRYNAWVILDQEPKVDGNEADNTGMNLSQVVPFGDGSLENFTGHSDWGVLPLGGFHNPGGPDMSNPYISNREVPQFPGEDFVVNAERFANLNLARNSSKSWGFILVGMEPDPAKVTINAESNFPLFILSMELLPGGGVHEFHNYTDFLPEIKVTVEMHD